MPKNRTRSQRLRARTPDDRVPHTTTHAPSDGLAAFRARLMAGDLDGIIGCGLRRSLRDAAADPSLDAEIGALRLALVRLLKEERDPSRLAAGVSRIAGVAVQAARLRQNPDANLNEIRSLLAKELDAVEAEYAQAAGPRAELKGIDADHTDLASPPPGSP